MKKLLEILQRLLEALEKLIAATEKKPEPTQPSLPTDSSANVPAEPTKPQPPANGKDDLDLATVRTLIMPHTPGVTHQGLIAAVVDGWITEASTDGGTLWTEYEPYRWPVKVGDGGELDAVCCFFYQADGAVAGGKFDWHRKGGQRAKTLKNVIEGYGGHRMPAKGTPCWTMTCSVDGKHRSNTKAVTWK